MYYYHLPMGGCRTGGICASNTNRYAASVVRRWPQCTLIPFLVDTHIETAAWLDGWKANDAHQSSDTSVFEYRHVSGRGDKPTVICAEPSDTQRHTSSSSSYEHGTYHWRHRSIGVTLLPHLFSYLLAACLGTSARPSIDICVRMTMPPKRFVAELGFWF